MKGYLEQVAVVVAGLVVFGMLVGIVDQSGQLSSVTRLIKRGFGG